jgi:hypothetical protein
VALGIGVGDGAVVGETVARATGAIEAVGLAAAGRFSDPSAGR